MTREKIKEELEEANPLLFLHLGYSFPVSIFPTIMDAQIPINKMIHLGTKNAILVFRNHDI